jgi:hypothetical protein
MPRSSAPRPRGDVRRDSRPARGAAPPSRPARAHARGGARDGASALPWRCSTRSSPATTKRRRMPRTASAIEDTVISDSSRRKGRTSMPSGRDRLRSAHRRRVSRVEVGAGRMLSPREGAESDERDDAFLIRQRSVLADHPLRLLVGQAVVVVGHRAGPRRARRRCGADVGVHRGAVQAGVDRFVASSPTSATARLHASAATARGCRPPCRAAAFEAPRHQPHTVEQRIAVRSSTCR